MSSRVVILSALLWLVLAGAVMFAVVTRLDALATSVVFLAWMGGIVTHMLLLRAARKVVQR
jgi:hypothetical protein